MVWSWWFQRTTRLRPSGYASPIGIGFRLEPEGRTGFAHLFEHMMFEGTPVAPKGTFDRVIEGGGGSNNADTRYDFTEYIDTAPVSALDPVLWLEADRLKTLDFAPEHLENQRKVVEEEVRVNVLNQPYGLFYAIDLPGKAFDRFPNAHNFYGDFKDLDAAKIQDVEAFFKHYYAPNNAVMAIAGDVTPAEVFAKVEKYFGGNSAAPGAAQTRPRRAAADRGAALYRAGHAWRACRPWPSAIACRRATRTTPWSARWWGNCCTTGKPRCFTRRW